MPVYHHMCKDCGPIIIETETISEYMEFEEEYGTTDKGDTRVPCPECDGWAVRDYAQGVAAPIVKGGHRYTTASYRAGAEEEWIRNEVSNSKRINNRGTAGDKRPYSNYYIKDPESMGFRKADDKAAKASADAARKTLGQFHEKVENARKK